MCRNIRVLYHFDPPTTDEEVRAAALQFVRKISGFSKPSAANETAFNRAVEKIAQASSTLLESLVTAAPPRNREAEIAGACAGSRPGSARSGAPRSSCGQGRRDAGIQRRDRRHLHPGRGSARGRGENPFRVRAYRNAARTVARPARSVAAHAGGAARTYRAPRHRRRISPARSPRSSRPADVAPLDELASELPARAGRAARGCRGSGRSASRALHDELRRHDARRAQAAPRPRARSASCRASARRPRSASCKALGAGRREPRRTLPRASPRPSRGAARRICGAAGRRRRATSRAASGARRETVGDLDILATGADAEAVMSASSAYDERARRARAGPTRRRRVRPALGHAGRPAGGAGEESYGAALHYFTGSKAHNIAIRKPRRRSGLKINEYGVFTGRSASPGDRGGGLAPSACRSSRPSCARTAARSRRRAKARLPELVERRGHSRRPARAHRRAPTARTRSREMAEAARARGLRVPRDHRPLQARWRWRAASTRGGCSAQIERDRPPQRAS